MGSARKSGKMRSFELWPFYNSIYLLQFLQNFDVRTSVTITER
jgi:hypothetical protein